MSLNHLKITIEQGNRPSALQHNGLVKALMRNRILGIVPRMTTPTPWPHPWEVVPSRFVPRVGSSLDPSATWQLDISPGTINDSLAAIPYLRTNDPRGWSAPKNYVEPASGASNLSSWIDRDSMDDLDDPPLLIIRDPAIGVTSSSEWTYIPDGQRRHVEGGAFCGADDWELELWQAYVLLSAVPLKTYWFSGSLVPPALKRYRLYTSSVKPDINFAAQGGGWLEVATLYMLRNPKAQNPIASAEIRVRQRLFWPVWTTVLQPGGALLDMSQSSLQGIDYLTGIFTSPDQSTQVNILQSAASVEWWTS